MKKIVFAPVLLIVLVWVLGSCHKTSAPAGNPITPLQALVNNDTSLSLFHRMLLAANENGLLADNAVTLLIPTNAAFRAAGYNEVIIDSLTPSAADRIISYHFINQVALPDSNGYKPYPTHLGHSVFGQRDGSQVWFNGATAGDTSMISKALVYRIDRVLLSPMDSLSFQLAADTSLSFTARLLHVTGVDTVLAQSQSLYTVLAPVNAAWRAAGYDSLSRIDSADHNTMLDLAKYHVVPGRYFSNTLTAGINSVVTLEGGSLTVGISNGVLQFSGTGNASPAHVLTADQLAGNSFVIHRIDQLLSK